MSPGVASRIFSLEIKIQSSRFTWYLVEKSPVCQVTLWTVGGCTLGAQVYIQRHITHSKFHMRITTRSSYLRTNLKKIKQKVACTGTLHDVAAPAPWKVNYTYCCYGAICMKHWALSTLEKEITFCKWSILSYPWNSPWAKCVDLQIICIKKW